MLCLAAMLQAKCCLACSTTGIGTSPSILVRVEMPQAQHQESP